MTDGTAAALAVVLLLQLTVICGGAHQMHKVTHDNKGGNDIQLDGHFLYVNVPQKKEK